MNSEGYPAEVYAHGIQIFMMTIMGFVCVPLSTLIFVKVFFHMKLTSVYEVYSVFDTLLA
jgi:energy-converting hydrogenase Eha subunit A